MPTEYVILRYHRNTLWFLQSFEDKFIALGEYRNMKKRYRGCNCKMQLKKCENGVISTLYDEVI